MSTQAVADPYWSRRADVCEASPRQDPVVWGKITDSSLTSAELERYERDGFHSGQDLFSSAEAEQLLAEAQRLAADVDQPRPGVVVEPGSRQVRSLFRVHHVSEIFRAAVTDPRLVDVARTLLGSDVHVYQSRVNYKPAFDGKEFFWHSDFETWHIEDGMPRMRAVSVSISLTENNEYNGPLMVVPRSHQTFVRCVGATPENHFEQSLQRQEYGVPSREVMRQLLDEGGMQVATGPPGSALFFECNLMHGSVGNLSPYPRTNLFIVYNSIENAVVEPFGERPPRPDFLAERTVIPIESNSVSLTS